jgi:CBS domain containing-hemolysin-like protein
MRRNTPVVCIAATSLLLGAFAAFAFATAFAFAKSSTKNTSSESHLLGGHKVNTMRLLHTVRKIPQEFAILLPSTTRLQPIPPQDLFYTFLATFHDQNAVLEFARIFALTNGPRHLVRTVSR